MKRKKEIKIFAHRGYSYAFPENTKLSFSNLKENNFDGVEFDVHQTKDNFLVVVHDEDIKRTSNGEGLVKNFTYKELLKYNFNNNFDVTKNQKILTLKEALKICDGIDYINIEVKSDVIDYKNIEKNLLKELETIKLKSKIIISSFNLNSLEKIKNLSSKYSLGWLCYKKEKILKNYNKILKVCNYINPWFKLLLDKKMVDFFKSLNIPLMLWTFEKSSSNNQWVKGSKEFFNELSKYKNIFGIISNNNFY